MAKFNTGQSFADGDQVTGAKLNNITSQLNIYTGVISEQTAMAATVSTADQLLIADVDNGDSGAANRVTVQKLLNDTLTNGTYTNAQLSGNLNVAQLSTLGTISSTRGTIGILNSTTGTITGLNTTTGTVATLNSTTGTITTLNSTTGTITGLNSTNGTIATLNSTTGTIAGLNSTNGTVATLDSTTGTITNLISTTGTIGNLSTTLAGDFTISQGTATLSTTGATAGTYGTSGIIPSISVDAKGRITTIGTAFGGKILQVVEATTSTQVSTSSTSHSDTGLSASITPSSASNKIIVFANQNYYAARSATNAGHAVKLVRTIGTNSSDVTTNPSGYESGFTSNGGSGATSTVLAGYVTIAALDSPSTTSQCTYKTQGRVYLPASSGIVYYQEASSPSRIILAEVAS